jgi:prepilin-type processing-associated H-X9-DG protein
MQIGWREVFCKRCTLPPPPPGVSVTEQYGDPGFGAAHSGVVNFGMCDGSVQPISKEIDVNVLDRVATRAGDDPYELGGTASACP